MKTTILLSLLFSSSIMAGQLMDRNLMEDYGTDRFSVVLKIQDFYGHEFKGKEHRYENNELTYSPQGHMGSVSVSNENKGVSSINAHQEWTTFSVFSNNRDEQDFAAIHECYELGSDVLLNIPTDRAKDMTLNASRLHKWIAYEEPEVLLNNRNQIYQLRDVIREINEAIKITKKKRYLRWARIYLKSMKKRNVKKLRMLMKHRDQLLAANQDWKVRKHIWVNMNYFPASCSLQ